MTATLGEAVGSPQPALAAIARATIVIVIVNQMATSVTRRRLGELRPPDRRDVHASKSQ
jgi:hypothetical protein